MNSHISHPLLTRHSEAISTATVALVVCIACTGSARADSGDLRVGAGVIGTTRPAAGLMGEAALGLTDWAEAWASVEVMGSRHRDELVASNLTVGAVAALDVFTWVPALRLGAGTKLELGKRIVARPLLRAAVELRRYLTLESSASVTVGIVCARGRRCLGEAGACLSFHVPNRWF